MRLSLQLILALSLAFIGAFIIQHYGPSDSPWLIYAAVGIVAGAVATLIV